MPKKIPTIEIKIRSNVPGSQLESLTSDMFFFLKNPMPPTTTKFPYFREDIAFTSDMLDGITAFEFFFHLPTFIAYVGDAEQINVNDSNLVQKTARENVIFMLKSLFVTSFPIEDNLESSYYANIQQTTTTRMGRQSIIPEFVAKWLFQTQPQFTYLSMGGIKYTVLGTMWINDVVNHSRYRQLMKDVLKYNRKKKKTVEKIEKRLNDIASKFTDKNINNLIQFLNEKTQNPVTTNGNLDVSLKPIQTWLAKNQFGNAKFEKALKGAFKNDDNKRKFLTIFIAPYLNEFYLQQEIITDLMSSRYEKRLNSVRLTEFVNDPNFRRLVQLSHDFYLQSQLKSFFTGKNTEPNLFAPVYTKSISALTELQSVLANDLEFVNMMNTMLEVVPDDVLELPKNTNTEYNLILTKLKVPEPNSRILLTTNMNLQTAIEEYVKKGCCDESFEFFASQLYDTYFIQDPDIIDENEDAKEPIKDKKKSKINPLWMTTDVVKSTKEMFAIEVQLELMQGILDEKIIQQISCEFGNKRLVMEYDRLKNKLDDVPLYLQQPRTLFSIETFLAEQNKGGNVTAVPVAVPVSGGTYRFQRQKKAWVRRTRRRRFEKSNKN